MHKYHYLCCKFKFHLNGISSNYRLAKLSKKAFPPDPTTFPLAFQLQTSRSPMNHSPSSNLHFREQYSSQNDSTVSIDRGTLDFLPFFLNRRALGQSKFLEKPNPNHPCGKSKVRCEFYVTIGIFQHRNSFARKKRRFYTRISIYTFPG